jgi:hypothetical protein
MVGTLKSFCGPCEGPKLTFDTGGIEAGQQYIAAQPCHIRDRYWDPMDIETSVQ